MRWDVIVPWAGLTLMLLIGAVLWVKLVRGVERSLLLRPSPRARRASLLGSVGGLLVIDGFALSVTTELMGGALLAYTHPTLLKLLAGLIVAAAGGALACLILWYRLLVRAYREETEGVTPGDEHRP